MSFSATEMAAVGATLGETDANKLGNRTDIEFQWAMKAYHHAETYFNLISSVDPKLLKLTQHDDEIYKHFREAFPDLSVEVLEEESLKKPDSKAKWREFCEQYKGKIEDYNMGTLIRVKSAEEFSENNSTLVVRVQFLALEIARNREGLNDGLRYLKSATKS